VFTLAICCGLFYGKGKYVLIYYNRKGKFV